MDTQSKPNASNVYSLPDEIIVMILQNCCPRDILNFSATCKQYNEVVKNHNPLWRNKYLSIFPSTLYKIVEEFYNGSWLREVKYYYELEKKIHLEVMAMSPKYYWISERSMGSVNLTSFFISNIATPKNFFYVIHILQDIIETAHRLLESKCVRPYTLTDMYYSKIVLRQLMHSYLAVKWTKAKVEKNLPPEFVVNFFLQWIYPANLHIDEAADKKINVLVKEVNESLVDLKKRSGHCSGLQIVNAVSQVIYKQRRIVPTTALDFKTIDISKAIDNRYINVVVIAAVYQAVAARCGVSCELIAFPKHLFLEWRDNDSPEKQLYMIDAYSGKISPQRQCPYAISVHTPRATLSYSPNSLLNYLYMLFVDSMGALSTWNSQNASYLKGFLPYGDQPNGYQKNPYENYYNHLLTNVNTVPHNDTPVIMQLTKDHIQLMISLTRLNEIDEVPTKSKIPKKHTSCVKFAVGMICYHKRYEYICIVRDWQLTAKQLNFALDDLHFGRNQPFYYVTAVDQSDRYVAQENLMEVTRPTRLHHLEYQISRDFTHFDGFAYCLNDEKRVEYPDDEHIVEVFRALCRDKPNNI